MPRWRQCVNLGTQGFELFFCTSALCFEKSSPVSCLLGRNPLGSRGFLCCCFSRSSGLVVGIATSTRTRAALTPSSGNAIAGGCWRARCRPRTRHDPATSYLRTGGCDKREHWGTGTGSSIGERADADHGWERRDCRRCIPRCHHGRGELMPTLPRR